jgi:hypothetical protein
MQCLQCERIFPAKVDGEIEPGGFMLCRGCGHVMVWTDDLSLRELTEKERIDAGADFGLMQARAKILPRRGVQSPGSWAVTCLVCVIIVMVVLERFGIVPLLHHK